MEMSNRFLCDEMLRGLARWLRTAGYDVSVANTGETDQGLLERAIEDNRIVLTRDRKMMEMRKARDRVVLLNCNSISECVADLNTQLPINWLLAPFSRCLLCNVPIVKIEHCHQLGLPPDILKNAKDVYCCPKCGKVYWEGGHVKRMRHQLEKFAKLKR